MWVPWSSVARVRFVQSDSHMISVGAEDRCVFQWKFEEDDEIDDADVINESESEGFKADMRDGSDLDRPELHDKGVDEFEDLLERESTGLGTERTMTGLHPAAETLIFSPIYDLSPSMLLLSPCHAMSRCRAGGGRSKETALDCL